MERLINPMILTSLLWVLLLWCIKKWFRKSPRNKNFPPSPMKMPIIGNLHQLGALPHRNLQSLSKKYGPLMHLHLGSVPVLIVSSAYAAGKILKSHDLAFSDRPAYNVFKKLIYDCRDVTVSVYGQHWRQMKSIFVLQLLSNKRVQSFRSIREEETALLVDKIGAYSSTEGAVDLSAMFEAFTIDVVSRAAFATKQSETQNGRNFMLVLAESMKVAVLTVGDFIPWLSWISRVNGFEKRIDRIGKGLDDFLESMIEEHLKDEDKSSNAKRAVNFLDVLLDIHKGNMADLSIERDSIKALLLDVFVGGTDTLTTLLEWTMSELLRHPNVMEKLHKEAEEIVGHNRDITHDDLEKMVYLKAVLKESIRCHPPLPLLVPRVVREDVKVEGYDVSAGTLVMFNAWAIGRDPASWDQPEKFMPERFLNSSIDFKGHNFELIPFGGGRRGCPGISFASVAIEFLIANLVHKFNWKLEGKDLDMSESPGATVRRTFPLLALPTWRS